MALSGIQIYKLLPQTNCKDCGFPTCLAFSMKLAAKQVELSLCPHVSDESKEKLSASAAPPIRMIQLSSNGHEIKAGNVAVITRAMASVMLCRARCFAGMATAPDF